jgi:4-hydroxybenzoate polyprenyltransferase
MTARLRLLVLLVRPAVMVLLALYAGLGLAQGGRGEDLVALAKVLAVVAAFLLFSVACNDLADEEIDRVNVPGERLLASGVLTRREFAVIGATAGVAALAASVTLGWAATVVTAGGLGVSAGYSLRPVRLADRGAVASLVLPACYVAVPYVLGVLAAGGGRGLLRPGTLMLLAGLYLGFIGRILLKDFRDLRGDALFGKRTFLVRHGRGRTCGVSAGCWLGGTGILLVSVPRLTTALAGAEAACAAGALVLLYALATDRGPRRDEAVIAAIAITGRGMMLLLLAHLSMMSAHWSIIRYDAVIAALTLLTFGPAVSTARHGPLARLTIPASLVQGTPGRAPVHPSH